MGDIMGRLWEEGTAASQVPEDLRSLQQWTREDLILMMNRFKTQDKLAIRLASFWRIVGLDSQDTAHTVWKALGLKDDATIDFLSVALPMIAMSNQEIISRVTFMFSVCDFNSNGTIKRSELFIGLRSLFKGLQRFFPKSKVPSQEELEEATDSVFKTSDKDKSGELDLEEILTMGYRSKGLRILMSPFPVQDHRIFESLIHFNGRDRLRERSREVQIEKVENTMKSKLMLSPDPCTTRGRRVAKRPKPWRDPSSVSKGRAFMLWAVFSEMSHDNTVAVKELRGLIGDRIKLKEVLEEAHARGVEGQCMEIADETKVKLIEGMQTHLLNPGFSDRLSACGQDELLSFRALAAMLWPNIPDKDITACIKWGRQFQAFGMLQELTKLKDSALTNADYDPSKAPKLDVTKDDVEALFEVLDINGDGNLTVAELIKAGGVNKEEVEKLMELWDRDRSEALSKGEIMSIIWNMNQVVRRQLKGLFSASVGNEM